MAKKNGGQGGMNISLGENVPLESSSDISQQFEILRTKSGFVDQDSVDGVLLEVIQTLKNEAPVKTVTWMDYIRQKTNVIPSTASPIEDGVNSKDLKLRYIRNYILGSVAYKIGTYSLRPLIFSYGASALPGLTLGKYFPDNAARSLLYSNIFFTAATLLSRSLLHKANSINESVNYFKAHYKDLEEYVEELFGLGAFKKTDHGFEYSDELNKIGRVILESWYEFMESKKIQDFSDINKFRVIDISLNMFKALSRYLIIIRAEELKKLIHQEAVERGFNDKNIVGEINYLSLIEQYGLDKRGLIARIPKLEISSEFEKKIITEFSALIESKTVEEKYIYKIIRGVSANHISFATVPDIMPFSSVLYKNGGRNIVSHSVSEQHKEHFVKDIAAIKCLQNSFSNLKLFTHSDYSVAALMSHIGGHIKNRVGMKFPWFINEGLSILSGMFGGLPIFTFIYQKENAVTAAKYLLPSVLWALSYGIECIKKQLTSEEKRFEHEYKEYELKLGKLVEKEHIKIKNYDGKILQNEEIEYSENFQRCMGIVSKVIGQTYHKAGINMNDLSHKEDAFFALRLFNAVGDFVLSVKEENKISDEAERNVINKLAVHCSSKISKGMVGAAFHGCFSNAYFSQGLSKKELINIISTLASNEATKSWLVTQSTISKQQAIQGNSLSFG